jgi:hypothetical protein
MKKEIILYLMLFVMVCLLTSCAPVTQVENAKLDAFFEKVKNNHSIIKKAELQKIDLVYLNVVCELTEDALDPTIRHSCFKKHVILS